MKFKPFRRLPEANITAHLFGELRKRSILCCLEYGHGPCRFDLVVIKNGDIVAIVEVKSAVRRTSASGAQLSKYMVHGVPVIKCVNLGGIEKCISLIEAILSGESAPMLQMAVAPEIRIDTL